jgi:phosphohistidine phosphatase
MGRAKTLYLLRHAKSSWDDPGLADHDRPLAPRGVRNTAALAGHLRAAGISPALILCSSALRARETLAGIVPALETDVEVRIEAGLYDARADRLLERLRDVRHDTPSVMVIGHNPGLEELAARIDAHSSAVPLPTATLATFELLDEWRTLNSGGAALVHRHTPRGSG